MAPHPRRAKARAGLWTKTAAAAAGPSSRCRRRGVRLHEAPHAGPATRGRGRAARGGVGSEQDLPERAGGSHVVQQLEQPPVREVVGARRPVVGEERAAARELEVQAGVGVAIEVSEHHAAGCDAERVQALQDRVGVGPQLGVDADRRTRRRRPPPRPLRRRAPRRSRGGGTGRRS